MNSVPRYLVLVQRHPANADGAPSCKLIDAPNPELAMGRAVQELTERTTRRLVPAATSGRYRGLMSISGYSPLWKRTRWSRYIEMLALCQGEHGRPAEPSTADDEVPAALQCKTTCVIDEGPR